MVDRWRNATIMNRAHVSSEPQPTPPAYLPPRAPAARRPLPPAAAAAAPAPRLRPRRQRRFSLLKKPPPTAPTRSPRCARSGGGGVTGGGFWFFSPSPPVNTKIYRGRVLCYRNIQSMSCSRMKARSAVFNGAADPQPAIDCISCYFAGANTSLSTVAQPPIENR
jgi:hypothetical protein